MTEEDRFWAKVTSGRADECWLWTAATEKDSGYPVFYLHGGQKMRGHRYSLMLKLGRPLLPGAQVCHTCHVRACVNPGHLYEGDFVSNTDDKVSAGRQMRGARSASTHLTDADVAQIRERFASGVESQGALARAFQVSQSEISRMVNRKSWRHVQ